MGSSFPPLAYSAVEFGDVDLDKDADLLLSGYNTIDFSRVTLLFANDGKGEFILVDSTTFPGSQQFPNKFIDIDGDNDLDLYISGSTGGAPENAALFRNDHCSTPITATDTRTECAPYVWIDGKSYTASNDAAKWTLTSSGGCDSLVTLNLTISTVDTSVSVNGETLTANVSGATYQWIDCGNGNSKIDGETGQSYTATKSGSFAVAITQNGCTDTSSCFSVEITSVNPIFQPRQIAVYPSRTNGPVHINMGGVKGNFTVTVTDISGRIISQAFYQNKQNLEMDMPKEAGMYLLTIITQDRKSTFRVVKE
jgi:hypothetical protein